MSGRLPRQIPLLAGVAGVAGGLWLASAARAQAEPAAEAEEQAIALAVAAETADEIPSHGAGAAKPKPAKARPPAPSAYEQDEPDHGDQSAAEDPDEAELKAMRKEIERLKAEYELMQQRQRNELLQAELRKQELESRASLRRAQRQAETEDQQAEVQRLEAQVQLLQAERSLREAELQERVAESQARAQQMAAENSVTSARVEQLNAQINLMKTEFRRKTAEVEGRLSYLRTTGRAKDHVLTEVAYPDDPLINGTLYISDRRIELDGPIWYGTADRVTERLHFYNNQNPDAPIFIVINDSPGGSVQEGYRIVKAIESSRAPVHVVVKSFAASMAALITTLAPHSYAYPDAVILHHQMSTIAWGNMTEIEEQLEWYEEMAARLMEPLAEEMNVSTEQLVEQMYENNSEGDWMEFADTARGLGWVDHVIDEIREDGIIEKPQDRGYGFFFIFFEHEERDSEGNRFIRLPRLKPFDAYYMYNPDGYYRP